MCYPSWGSCVVIGRISFVAQGAVIGLGRYMGQSLFPFLKRSQFWNFFGPGALERIGAITMGSDTHFRPLLVVWSS